ncbi:MAG TPA: pyrimidine 5'-nucleotidase [Stellaceae bacterium]|nr:pyrimidine 5'-nucleotidase [Stellaceae bacterium]
MDRFSRPPLSAIETWIFDLDNTLYPGTCQLYAEIERRMGAFIMAELKLDRDSAHALRQRFLERHGTTLKGLMIEHGMAPERFLDYVHEIDLSSVAEDRALGDAIAGLPGRKLIFTNGTKRHAERVLARLGLGGHFAAIHDIVACDYCPKPEPAAYAAFVRQHDIDPHRAAMAEDMARNLPPAAMLGMTTIWVSGGPHPHDDGHAAHIHYRVEHRELAPFLRAITRPPVIRGAE